MRTVSLAGTTLSTSRLGFGTSGLHQLLRGSDRQGLLAAAFDAGVRHFDTSPFYGHGIGERELGEFARGRRSELLIATKFGIKASPLLARAPLLLYAQLAANALQRKVTKRNRLTVTPARDYTAGEARRSLEGSLRALRTDHVDIFFLHEPRLAVLPPRDDLAETLERLRGEGKARYIGLAAAACECVAVATRFPSLAQVMQLNAAAGVQEFGVMRAAGLPCHVSFGHFRGKRAPVVSLLTDALRQNERGVVLFSTRRPAHVAEMAANLTDADRQ